MRKAPSGPRGSEIQLHPGLIRTRCPTSILDEPFCITMPTPSEPRTEPWTIPGYKPLRIQTSLRLRIKSLFFCNPNVEQIALPMIKCCSLKLDDSFVDFSLGRLEILHLEAIFKRRIWLWFIGEDDSNHDKYGKSAFLLVSNSPSARIAESCVGASQI